MKINEEKLQQYIAEEKIIEFNSEEECRIWFNTYDYQKYADVEEMKRDLDIYGFSHNGKYYSMCYDEALDVYKGVINMRKDKLYNVTANTKRRTSLLLDSPKKIGFPLAIYARNKDEAIEKSRVIVNDHYNRSDEYMGNQYTYKAELEEA